MAKVTDVFVKGKVGNLIFYRRMGTQCVRTQASKVHRSEAMKMRSFNFGIASKAAKALRSGLTPAMPLPTDRSMQSRFSGALSKWLGLSSIDELAATERVRFVSDFEFTKEQPVRQRFKVPFSISQPQENVFAVSIEGFVPSREIAAPSGTGLVTLIISVAGCLLKTGESTGDETHTIAIPYNDTPVDPQVFEFHVNTFSQCLLLVAARLIYKKFQYNNQVEIRKELFVPAGVIYAGYKS